MELYLAGTDVNLSVPLVDRNGNALTVDLISYRVVDQDGVEKVASIALDTYAPGDAYAAILVPAVKNIIAEVPADSAITSKQIDTFNTREARVAELSCTLASGNTIVINVTYGLEHQDPLRVGINSFQPLTKAELTAMDISNLTGWNAASDQDKIAAMITARNHICQLNFWLLNSNTNWGQDNMNYVPEGAYQTQYASAGANNMFVFNGNLGLLTPLQYGRLPERFKTALRLAQVAEADSILGGDPVELRRREGLLLESIGEVKQMFRTGKPLDLPVSKRALRYLSAFVTFSKRIGRG
jgi:hypothetical protein